VSGVRSHSHRIFFVSYIIKKIIKVRNSGRDQIDQGKRKREAAKRASERKKEQKKMKGALHLYF
jgi:hypothetical protein